MILSSYVVVVVVTKRLPFVEKYHCEREQSLFTFDPSTRMQQTDDDDDQTKNKPYTSYILLDIIVTAVSQVANYQSR